MDAVCLLSWCVELTNQRKASLAVLVLAGVGLVVDKVFLGTSGPAIAKADEQAPQAEAAAGGTPVTASAATHRPAAERVEQLAAPDSAVIDAFALPARWRQAEPAVAEAQPEIDAAAVFARQHSVSVLLRSGKFPGRAMVSGRLLSVGDRLGQAVLIDVDDHQAVFEVGGLRVPLRLRPEQGVGQSLTPTTKDADAADDAGSPRQ